MAPEISNKEAIQMVGMPDWTKPLMLAMNGSPVRCLCGDRKFLHDERLTRVILINDPQQGELLGSCTEDGYLYPGNEYMAGYRVINRPEDDND